MTPELADKLAGRLVVASVSGGKDSAAMCLWLQEHGIEHERVFADTGWEHEDTYRYLREVLAPRLGPIAWVRGALPMADLVRKKGMFPSRFRRFCTQELKAKPLDRHLKARIDATGRDLVNAVGIRAEESPSRAAMSEWEFFPDLDVWQWRPLISWGEEDVVAIHRRHGLPPNPLYLRGATRVGCWPCVFSSKEQIRLLAEQDPARVAEIRALEADVEVTQRQRRAAAGETLESRGLHPPTFFLAPDVEAARALNRQWPIDRMVEWSRTPGRGPEPESGCVRWGLCGAEDGGTAGEAWQGRLFE